MHHPKRLALTGGIASGKSLVGEYLLNKNIPVIDADDEVHRMLREDEELRQNIRDNFGSEFFTETGDIDRPKLGEWVFTRPEERKLLESWIHPKIRGRMLAFFASHEDKPLVAAIIPLLFESQIEPYYDEVWLLETPYELQMQRLLEKRGMLAAHAEARIASQMSAEEKRKRGAAHPACHVIINAGDIDALYRDIDQRLAAAIPQ